MHTTAISEKRDHEFGGKLEGHVGQLGGKEGKGEKSQK